MPKPHPEQKAGSWNVAIALQLWTSAGRRAVSGIVDYGLAHPDLFRFRDAIFVEDDQVPEILRRMQVQGAIINMSEIVYREVGGAFPDITMVNIGSDLLSPEIPSVAGIRGRGSALLMQHLRAQGCHRFAYIGPESLEAENVCADNLRRLLRKSERPLGLYSLPGLDRLGGKIPGARKLAAWLKDIAKDAMTGVLAYDAYRAAAIIATCQELGLAVPEQVAVVSYIEEQSCLTTYPAITSIEGSAYEWGYSAMQVLHQKLLGESTRGRILEVGEPKLIVRGSSRPVNEEWMDIAATIRFMEENVESGLNVNDCIAHLGTMSRATFYRTFQQVTGMSPGEHLCNLRIERAKELLRSTGLSVTRIAGMCGFGSVTQFGDAFKRHVGKTPRAFRKERSAC